MANSIALAEKFQPILDEIYKRESLTARLDAPTKPVDFGGADTVNVFKTSVVGLGDYDRATGYPAGDVTATWEALQLSTERGREMTIDRMDNDETLGMAFGTLANEFIRTQVAPEVDAYRFATYAGWSGIDTVSAADLTTASAVLAAFDVAMGSMDDNEVPGEGRICYMAGPTYRLLTNSVDRSLKNESTFSRQLEVLDKALIIPVPQTRFLTAIELDAGASASAGGFSAATGAVDINFLLLHPTAVLQATKHANLKLFDPDVHQGSDSWLVQYRLYHEAFVYENKVDGVYLHKNTS
jgi:hypothetical protein